MAEPNKQTLFRFRTMRAPELIAEEDKTNYFIEHFDGETGVFFTALAGMEPEEERSEVLATAAEAYENVKTADEIKAIDNDLYELGLYLLKNRTRITFAEADTAVGVLTGLTAAEQELIWDNLFYQTVTLADGYAREAALVILLANHFVVNFASIPETDDAVQAWASSRVIVPFELFGSETTFTESSTVNESATGIGALNKQLEVAVDQMKIDQLAKLKTEMAEYKTAFYKTNNALEKQAIKTHMAAIQAARDAATSEDYVDQFNGYTFKRYTDYVEPAYEYTKPAEIDMDPLGEYLSTESAFVLLENRLNTTSTFEELENEIVKLTEQLTASNFEKTSFADEKVVIDGNIASKCGVDERFKKKNSYLVKLVKRSTNKYSLMVTVDTGSSCLLVDEVSTVVDVPTTTTHKTTKSTNVNGILTIDLTNGGSIDMTSATQINFSSTIKMNNGTEMTFGTGAGPLLLASQQTGIMTVSGAATSALGLQVPTGFGVRNLGISDYRRVEQTLCCYVPGEVSHIENLMAREYKERSTRRLRRQEDTTTTSTSVENENMNDTSTTTRFDIQKEISQVLSESKEANKSNSFSAGTSGSTSVPLVGDVDFTLNTDFSSDFSTTNSQEDSVSESTNFAKDVTEKALQRVVSKVSEERVSKIIEEFEEKNQHGFDNRKGAEHISGVYRWVDKIYKNQVYNYGKRLQYEFMIPEPAEFHTISKAGAAGSLSSTPLIKPLDPRTNAFGAIPPMKNAIHVNETNFNQWAAKYGAVVSPPPKTYLHVGKTLLRPDDGTDQFHPKTVKDEITIPEGYCVDCVMVSAGASYDAADAYIDISVCGITLRYYSYIFDHLYFGDGAQYPDFKYAHGSIPVSGLWSGHVAGSITISVRLARKHVLLQEWQLETFNAIMNAYEARLDEYKNALAELEAKQGAAKMDNPAYYRLIEQTVLKKNCIAYLTGHNYMGQDYTVGHELMNNQVSLGANMDKYAAAVKFFEQAFEWNMIDYEFYPFYWAGKQRWEELYATKNEDPLFKSFLSAGMARVIVTVRPRFEEAVMYFMKTGVIWNGGTIPLINDPLYLSIVKDLAEPEKTVGESWETRVPSTLTLIQASTIALEAEGLPCYCDSEVLPVEDIVMPEVNPLTGLDVFIEGDNAA